MLMRFRNDSHLGSSPRVRGKLPRQSGKTFLLGLIPARAGKTRCCARGVGVPPAHPRACGENKIAVRPEKSAVGSSPRVRGKRRDGCCGWGSCGLIPARAGKTAPQSPTRCATGAHPRACGENLARAVWDVVSAGSSPRVRGKHRGPDRRGHQLRLIPARAGKTMRTQPPPPPRWAHPRACGENMWNAVNAADVAGSSPRVRGKPVI